MNEALRQKLKTLPSSPGVYFHKNNTGEIIYVGKAAVLKNRVRQYFQKSKKDPKTEALVAEIFDTDWVVVDTEMDALFLEAEMIKRYMPKWNILLRDDKTVLYVRIDLNNEIPYVSLTRNPMDDKATYIGPFYGKSVIERALRTLRRIFPYYNKPYTGKKTLDTDLGLTPGIEINKTTPKDYRRNLKKLVRYLHGDRRKLLDEIEKNMYKESSKGNYELAAEARNQLDGLRALKKRIIFSDKEFLDISSDQALKQLQDLLHLSAPPRRIEGYDISHQSGSDTVGSMVVFINGASARSEYRKFKIRTSRNDDLKSMQEIVRRRLKHNEWGFPDLIILDGGKTQINAVLPLIRPYNIPIIGRDKSGDHARNAEVKLIIPRYSAQEGALDSSETTCLELPSGSHIARLVARIDEEAHRFAITYHSLLKRKNMLK
ncbi:GIY-YIG nuclease family protein [Candidatus Saccharibacteria bacterium]|nr:GIY-YIG nuclease family protein [Candidatus Saccharibacteria bacterium]